MNLVVYPGITKPSKSIISAIFYYEGKKLLKYLDHNDKEMELTASIVIFPHLMGEKASVMHDVHMYTKSFLMSCGIMVGVFFEGYDKPALNNPDFMLYQSPFPMAAFRPMSLRDISFVERNREGFLEYRSRYKALYHEEKIPAKYGYYERFEAAEKRFNLES